MELEFKARQTSKQTNIHTKKNWTLKLRCLQPPVEMKHQVEWSNIIFHKQTCHIFCNHLRVCATDIINQVSSVTHTQCQHPCYITEQYTIANRTFHDPDHGSESHIWSWSSEWIQILVLHCNIGQVNPLFPLCQRFWGTCYICLYVC